jgi:undecaprenyl-diphosphatase
LNTNLEPTPRPRWIEDAERIDLAIYAAIARTPTPAPDVAMSRLSRAADYSRLSLASAALLALAGGRTGRRAATQGLASLAVTATVVNVAVKPLARRRRPDRPAGDVPLARHVRMPSSRSFPSGHSAAAFAFATGVGHVSPAAAAPLRALAALVAYSRVHTGVHYPARAGRRPARHRAGATHDTRALPIGTVMPASDG